MQLTRTLVRTNCMGRNKHLPSVHPAMPSSVTLHCGTASIVSRFMLNPPSLSGSAPVGVVDKKQMTKFTVKRKRAGNQSTPCACTRCSSPSGGPNQVWREAAAHQRAGGRAKKNGACVGRPRLEGLEDKGYAALAFLAAVGRAAGFGWVFAVVFLAACAFSFAANSALTFCAIASVSTL
jgi:hypothetical protein